MDPAPRASTLALRVRRAWRWVARIIVGGVLIAPSTCSRHDLTTEHAAAIISGQDEFAKPYTLRIVAGRRARCHPVFDPDVYACVENYAGIWQYFVARDAGLLEVKPLWLADGYFTKPAFDVVLLANAKASNLWKESEGGWLLPIATREFIAVTGIAKLALAGEDLAEATYTWKWLPTALLERDKFWVERFPFGELQQSRATLHRFDDGWRLEGTLSIAALPDPDLTGYQRDLPAAVVEVVWENQPRDVAESDLQKAAAAERELFGHQGRYVSCESGSDSDPTRLSGDGGNGDCRAKLPGFVASEGVAIRIDSQPESFRINACRHGASKHYVYASSDVGTVAEHDNADDCARIRSAPGSPP